MTEASCIHVLDDATSLSLVARGFLRENASRFAFDTGLTGDDLREEVGASHVDGEGIADLLQRVQCRYGGLRYLSRYFGDWIDFTPVCEPEPGSELEISYVISTGSPAGACIRKDGVLNIILDDAVVEDFSSLDSLIEYDATLECLLGLPSVSDVYVQDLPEVGDVLDRLRRFSPGVRIVDNASGRRSTAFASDDFMVCVSSVWSELGGLMPSKLYVGAHNSRTLEMVVDSFC
jgi:hypothetical protein